MTPSYPHTGTHYIPSLSDTPVATLTSSSSDIMSSKLVTRSVFTAQQNRTLTGQLDLSLNVLQLPCCALEAFETLNELKHVTHITRSALRLQQTCGKHRKLLRNTSYILVRSVHFRADCRFVFSCQPIPACSQIGIASEPALVITQQCCE